jgi:hypothetical protein
MALAYGSFIQEVLTAADVDYPSFPYTSISSDKEFNPKTFSMMGYFWCDERRTYKFVPRGHIPRIVEEYDESDESEEEDQEENEEEGAGQAFEQHDSPPQADTHDYTNTAWV